jgi:phospholipid/cholesterol/gamma-HCH transport system ATP-binding protein
LFNGRPLWLSRGGFEQDSKLLSRIGFSFQNNALFTSLRVAENLMFPHSQRFPSFSSRDRVRLASEWLDKVGLKGTELLFPHELSGGMQKRLALARTLMLEPEFIFLDDPTAGLDPITSRHISEMLETLLKGRHCLVVIVTNDSDRARAWSSQLHFLEAGHLHSHGASRHQTMIEAYRD